MDLDDPVPIDSDPTLIDWDPALTDSVDPADRLGSGADRLGGETVCGQAKQIGGLRDQQGSVEVF